MAAKKSGTNIPEAQRHTVKLQLRVAPAVVAQLDTLRDKRPRSAVVTELIRRALLGAALMLAGGCAPSKIDLPGTVTVDASFAAPQIEVILQAIDSWRAATRGVAALSVSIGDGGELHIHPARLDDDRTLGATTLRAEGPSDLALDMQTVRMAARAERRMDGEVLLDTTMHELGHAFGLDHVPGGLMRAEGYGGAEVDPGTLARFCENYWCPRP